MVAVAVGDGALLEVRDAVFRDEADKIAPLLFNPKSSPEQNRAEGRWIQQHTSFDVGFIWDRRYLSLLHGVYQEWYVSRVVYPWQVGQEEHLECRIPMGLFLELSVPHRDESHDFWTGGWTDCGPRWFWPIPRPKSQTIPYHDEQCKEYPQCLDQMFIVTASDKYMISTLEPVYRLVLRAWMFHTLTEELTEGGITYRVPRPPTLRRLCRFVIRRNLARHCGEQLDTH
ncbi:hypothetical protein D915_006824 [Fasciola hepatica]|uniref:SOCS box domain-containing protein n=1 Tax=Fasciola hepatica TaxID=6192 RepID=A0A4E0RWR0_FASHE|nr:hypothetical protein D915_006824 [Fasciola hepatica]